MRINILFAGKAGQGPNILTHVLGDALISLGYHTFYSRDYQSLIRGGHNFNVLTFSDEPVFSNDSKIDIIVSLSGKMSELHKKDLNKGGFILEGDHPNMYFAGRVFKILGLQFKVLENELKKLKKRFEENLEESKKGYDEATRKLEIPVNPKIKSRFMNGNVGIGEGAVRSGLDVYYAYPMTPSTSVLTYLAGKQNENNHVVLELEGEIAIINAAIGTAMTGAKTMCGTSGGGFDLMTEGLSLCGIAQIPLVIFLAQRPGPATGVPTYTSQGDLNIVRHAGHGEFNRVIFAPSDPKDAHELTNQAFYFSQKFKIPAIVISDKHLGESYYSVLEKPKTFKVPKTTEMRRYNSYEQDEVGSATEDAKIIEANVLARLKKGSLIEKESLKFETHKVSGNEKSKNVILFWGSTKGAIMDASKKLDCKLLQVKYIEPFPKEIANELKGKNIILVENNATGQLGSLLAEKTGIVIKDENKILRFDGRPFLADELKIKLEEKCAVRRWTFGVKRQ